MAVPDFQTLMRPILELHEDGSEKDRAPLKEALAQRFELTDEERAELLPSGGQRLFDNRIGWSLTHLAHAGLIDRPRRGVTCITDRGRQVLTDHPNRVDMSVLNQFDEYLEFRGAGKRDAHQPTPVASDDSSTPEERLQVAHQELTAALIEDLRDRVLAVDPDQFERLVIDLLVAMGYGGSRSEAGQRLGRSGDEGIDGVIREDRLGLDAIYVQAKRWDPSRSVGRPDVQAFVGALQGQRASKGVFITTAGFSSGAKDYATGIGSHVVLIDGHELAELMIEHDVGVSTRQTYEIKRLDEDYFAELA